MTFLIALATFVWGFLFGMLLDDKLNKRNLDRLNEDLKSIVWEK